MAKRLVLFNHKGGVSKTTTVYNLGWILSLNNKKILLVDADPQCNLTSLLLRDNFEEYYFTPATSQNNIKDGVAPAFSGRPVPIAAVHCPSVAPRAPNLFFLPGHANLSEYDAALTFAQTSNNAISTLQNLPGAFNQLLTLCEAKYEIDYTFVDLNPGLSAINQNLFVNCDLFIIPTNPDPFSIMAIDTLKSVLPRWANWKLGAQTIFADSAYPLSLGTPRFGGTLIQRFNIRNGRAARPYRDNIDEIKGRVLNELWPALERAGMGLQLDSYPGRLRANAFCLGEIPDFGGLLPKAYNAGVPVFELTDQEIGETGPILLGMQNKRGQLRKQFADIAEEIEVILDNA
jgi:chromosome partitioning protein